MRFLATYSESIWPVYLMQETDVTGCLVEAELEPARARWLAFRARYPNAYPDGVARELTAIDDAAKTAPCVMSP